MSVKVNLANVKVYTCPECRLSLYTLIPPGINGIDSYGQPIYIGGLYECPRCKARYWAQYGQLEEDNN